MARARLLKPGFFTNEVLAELPFEGRLLFAGLWTLADREGRLEERAGRIKAAVFPFDGVDVQSLLVALETKGFIERYRSGAMPLIQIAKFTDHQTPHRREPASTLQPPPTTAFSGTGPAVTGNGSSSVTGNGSVRAELRSSPPHVDPFLTFPTQGKPDLWVLTVQQVEAWAPLYPGLDLYQECRTALGWAAANPGRRKTAKGMPAFLVNWFSRSVDRRSGDRRAEPDRREPDRLCRHEPPCMNPGNWQCQQRTVIEAARKKRATA